VLSGALKPAIEASAVGVHCGVGVAVGEAPLVGDGVGLAVGGGPGQIATLISANGNPVGVVLLLPPPQLKSSAAERKATTGTSTKDLRNQTIEPCTMPTQSRGVKHRPSRNPYTSIDGAGFSGWKKSGGRLIKGGKA